LFSDNFPNKLVEALQTLYEDYQQLMDENPANLTIK
jgi:hypothetical protein